MVFQWHDLILLAIPGLIAVITKPEWPGTVKYLVAIGICALASFAEFYLSVWIVGGVQQSFWTDFVKSFLVIFGTYAGIWKPLGAADRVESRVNG